MITNHTCLNLNKKSIRKKVITRLQKLGYKINDNATALETRAVIKEFQFKNGIIADGYIGYNTEYKLLNAEHKLLNGDIYTVFIVEMAMWKKLNQVLRKEKQIIFH